VKRWLEVKDVCLLFSHATTIDLLIRLILRPQNLRKECDS
jgi:hypothetical protein